jgi:hypothetical protein
LANIGKRLGANKPAGATLFVLFIPSVDRHEKPINQKYWIDKALRELATLFRGATAYPRGKGMWRDDEQDGRLISDEPVIVTSYANSLDVTAAALKQLRMFLHRIGREANQGEVGLVVNKTYYGITEYDED